MPRVVSTPVSRPPSIRNPVTPQLTATGTPGAGREAHRDLLRIEEAVALPEARLHDILRDIREAIAHLIAIEQFDIVLPPAMLHRHERPLPRGGLRLRRQPEIALLPDHRVVRRLPGDGGEVRGKTSTDSRTSANSSALSNWSRKPPVAAAVVSVQRAGRRSSSSGRNPARAAKNAVAAPTIPPPMMTRSAVGGRSVM